jgi:hypothetical protein
MSVAPAEWGVKEDLALLKRLGLVETREHGRGGHWPLLNQRLKWLGNQLLFASNSTSNSLSNPPAGLGIDRER